MGAWRAAALATEFGFTVVGSLVGGVLLGQYLDQRFSMAPVFFLIGLLLGFVFSIYLIYVIYRIQVQPARRRAASNASASPDAVRRESERAPEYREWEERLP